MKQIPITPELEAKIKAAVGQDVDTSKFSVFEAIAFNTLPIPGKDGTFWEGARASYLTLRQMADHIENGNHIPLIADHDMSGAPKGRVFSARVLPRTDGEAELRVLFYLDGTESILVEKLNAGSLDEVSVAVLPSQYLCSECGWDYLGEDASWENFSDRTCGNGHIIGTDGVYVRLVGMASFRELSMVATGAADNAKIVGKSQSKLQPGSSMRLAARGFEVDDMYVQARQGEEIVSVDFTKLTGELVDSRSDLKVAQLQLTAAAEKATGLEASLATANEQIATLTAEVATLTEGAAKPATDLADAVAFMKDLLSKTLTAAGEAAPEALPETVAELKASITEHSAKLSAVLPIGGVSNTVTTTNDDETASKVNPAAFSTRNR